LLSVVGAGSVYAQATSEERPVADFSRLVVRDGIDVYLTQSATPRLRIEVEAWDLADVVTQVEGDTLTLSIPSKRNGSSDENREATAYLDFVQLSTIQASGGSDLESRNDLELDDLAVEASGGSDVDLDVNAQNLEFSVSGGSDVEISGATTSLSIQASGGSDVSAEFLRAERATASVSGGSDASIRASAAIVVNANGGSDVIIHGDPPQRTVNNDRSSDIVWY
jgi:hypothetical protein